MRARWNLGVRRLVYAFSLLLLGVPYGLYTAGLPNMFGVDDPVVLIVGDTSAPSYGRLALSVKWQREAGSGEQGYMPLLIHLPEGASDPLALETAADQASRIRRLVRGLLLPKIAQRDVIAIIANTTSTLTPAVLDVANTFRVPTLLTVATNDALLSRPNNSALRLIPADSLQVAVILREIRLHRSRRVAVFYEPGRYGRGLYARLSNSLRGARLYPYILDEEGDALAMLPSALRFKPDLVVVLAYRRQTQLLALSLDAVPPSQRPPILFSDGAFGAGAILDSLPAGRVIFPVGRLAIGPIEDRIGYHVFFHDALAMLRAAIPEARRARTALRSVLQDSTRLNELIQLQDTMFLGDYLFTRGGENSKAAFAVLAPAVLDSLLARIR